MREDDDEKEINLTHFINPHQFWYTRSDDVHFGKVQDLENNLKKRYQELTVNFRIENVAIKSLVAVDCLEKGFIRARVEEKLIKLNSRTPSYIVWSVDHGFPLEAEENHMRYLPEEFRYPIDRVRLGGIAKVVPGEQIFDFLKQRTVMRLSKDWSIPACEQLDELLRDAASIVFSEKFQNDGHYWGDLHITNHQGKMFHISDYVVNEKFALRNVEKFKDLCLMSKSTQKPLSYSNRESNCRKVTNYSAKYEPYFNEQVCQVNQEDIQSANKKVASWSEHNEKAYYFDGLDTGESSVSHLLNDTDMEDSVSKCGRANGNRYTPSLNEIGIFLKPMHPAGPMPTLADFGIEDKTVDFDVTKYTDSSDNKTNVSVQSNRYARHFLELRKKHMLKMAEQGEDDVVVKSPVSDVASSCSKYNPNNPEKTEYLELQNKHMLKQVAKQIKKDPITKSPVYDIAGCFSRDIQNLEISSEKTEYLELQNKHISKQMEEQGKEGPVTKSLVSDVASSCSKDLQNPEVSSEETEYFENRSTHSDKSKLLLNRQRHFTKLRMQNANSKPFKNNNDTSSEVTTASLNSNRQNTNDELLEFATRNQNSIIQKARVESSLLLKTIPAGFDLTNLNTYRDKNHWHLKNTTRNQKPQHKPLKNPNCENQSQGFRFTRPNTEKYKRIFSTSVASKNPQPNRTQLVSADKPKNSDINLNDSNDLNFVVSESSDIKTINQNQLKELNTNLSAEKNALASRHSGKMEETKSLASKNSQPETSQFVSADKPKNADFNLNDSNDLDFVLPESSDSKNFNQNQVKEMNTNESAEKNALTFRQLIKVEEIFDLSKEETKLVASKSPQPKTTQLVSADKPKNSDFNLNESKDFGSVLSDSSQSSDDTRYSSAHSYLDTDSQEENNLQKTPTVELKPIRENIKSTLKTENVQAHRHGISNYLSTNLKEPVNKQESLETNDGDKCIRTKYVEHLVLAHCQMHLNPIESLNNTCLAKTVIKEMNRMHIDKVYRIQSYAWSHLLSSNGLFIINAPSSGKTWSYLPPLCSSIIFNFENSVEPSTYGPMAIILVQNGLHAQKIGYICKRFLSKLDQSDSKTIISYGVQHLKAVKIQLMEGCGVLVTTPSNLLRLMQHNEQKEPLFDRSRIQYIVIDNIDVMISRLAEDFDTVLKKLYAFLPKVDKGKKLIAQLVVTSCHYVPAITKLIPITNQPLLLIGDLLEAAVYGKAKFSIKICPKQEKLTIMRNYIKDHSNLQERLIILCNSDSDVIFVSENLNSYGIPNIGCHSKSPTLVWGQMKEEWKLQLNSAQVLVCNDAVFPELEITNAHHLIHYSLSATWTKFTLRFVSLINTHENSVVKGFNRPQKNPATSLVFLDEDNNTELPRFINFLKVHNQLSRVAPEVLLLSKNIQIQREEKRCSDNIQLCSSLFEFGECINACCGYRHVLLPTDVKQNDNEMIRYGDIRLKVLKVFSPTHFSAQIIEHRLTPSSKWEIVRQSDKAVIFAFRLNSFYNLDPSNLEMHWPVEVNDLCICKIKEAYYRARVLEMSKVKANKFMQSHPIRLKLIDIGEEISSNIDELYVCHDQFRDFPAQAVDIRLIGVLPFDNENEWDTNAREQVEYLIKRNLKQNECVHASIDFALDGAIWVNKVLILEQLSIMKTAIYIGNLGQYLINKNCGISNKNVIRKIHSIINEQGFGYIFDKPETEKNDNTAISSEASEDTQMADKIQLPSQIKKHQHIDPISEISPMPSSWNMNISNNHIPVSDIKDEIDNADLLQVSEKKAVDIEIASAKSNKSLCDLTQKSIKKSNSPLPVCNFMELVKCIQNSLRLEMEEYEALGSEKCKLNLRKHMRETEEMCNALINNEKKGNQKQIKSEENIKTTKETETNPERPINSTAKNKIEISPKKESQNNNQTIIMPGLVNLHQRPRTLWYETNYLIMLSIHAPDIDDYYLEVTSHSLYFTAFVGDAWQVLILNFLGAIEPNLVSHEIRGLKVVVRLVKNIYGKWPRLLKGIDKMHCLTYDLNWINSNQLDDILPQQLLGNALHEQSKKSDCNDDDSTDSEENEYNLYKTFNPIVDKDFHDPLSKN